MPLREGGGDSDLIDRLFDVVPRAGGLLRDEGTRWVDILRGNRYRGKLLFRGLEHFIS